MQNVCSCCSNYPGPWVPCMRMLGAARMLSVAFVDALTTVEQDAEHIRCNATNIIMNIYFVNMI